MNAVQFEGGGGSANDWQRDGAAKGVISESEVGWKLPAARYGGSKVSEKSVEKMIVKLLYCDAGILHNNDVASGSGAALRNAPEPV